MLNPKMRKPPPGRRDPATGIYAPHDPYNQDGLKKALGYPQGQATMFLAGRLLQECHFGGNRGFIAANGGPATTDTVVNFNITGNERAMYLYWVEHGACFDYTENVQASWQIWVDGKFATSGISAPHVTPIGIWIPPNCVCTFYSRIINSLAAGAFRYFPYGITWVEFSSEKDVWEFGKGTLTANPAIAGLVWP